jgi:protein phosphatase 1 regulatory subunit 11
MSREGSHTALVLQNPAEQRDASAPPAGTLCLRGGPRNGPRVAWDEAVVDNEGLGRKKSKSTYLVQFIMLNWRIDRRLFQVCCIYHRPRRFDESSDEEDEESSETDPSSDDNGTAKPSGQYRRHRHRVDEERGRCREHKRLSDRDDHNAYERISPHKGKGKGKSN